MKNPSDILNSQGENYTDMAKVRGDNMTKTKLTYQHQATANIKRYLKKAAKMNEDKFNAWCEKANKFYDMHKEEIQSDDCYKEMVMHDVEVMREKRRA